MLHRTHPTNLTQAQIKYIGYRLWLAEQHRDFDYPDDLMEHTAEIEGLHRMWPEFMRQVDITTEDEKTVYYLDDGVFDANENS